MKCRPRLPQAHVEVVSPGATQGMFVSQAVGFWKGEPNLQALNRRIAYPRCNKIWLMCISKRQLEPTVSQEA